MKRKTLLFFSLLLVALSAGAQTTTLWDATADNVGTRILMYYLTAVMEHRTDLHLTERTNGSTQVTMSIICS